MLKLVICLFILAINGTYINEDILKKSDDAFFPEIAKFKINLKLYENYEYKNYYELVCYIKGNRKYLAYFVNPPIMRKQAHLRVDNNIWQYLGKIKKSIRLSAKANFSGSTFSEEDILSTSLGYYYNLDDVTEVSENNQKLLKLKMLPKSDKTAYSRIESFINPTTYLPVRRMYYSYSGQLIKELEVKEIKKEKNKLIYIHFVMYDKLREGVYSELEFQNIEYLNDLSDRIFTKKYMEIASE